MQTLKLFYLYTLFTYAEVRSCPSVLIPATLTENEFAIVSPNYPRNYIPLESCAWNVWPQSCARGQLIEGLVEYADISTHLLRFTFDSSREIVITGSTQNFEIVDSSCKLNVLFDTSENAAPGVGFEFSYKGAWVGET